MKAFRGLRIYTLVLSQPTRSFRVVAENLFSQGGNPGYSHSTVGFVVGQRFMATFSVKLLPIAQI